MATAMAELLSPTEAAAALGLSTAHLRHLSVRRKIRARMTPLGRLYAAAEVERVRVLRENRPRRGRRSKGEVAAAS